MDNNEEIEIAELKKEMDEIGEKNMSKDMNQGEKLFIKNEVAILGVSLKEDFGLPIENLTPIDIKEAGDNSEVYFGELNSEKVFIKIGDETHLRHFNVEISAQELFRDKGIPSPQTIAFKEKTKHIDRPVAIQTAVEGIALRWLNEPERQSIVWQEAGEVLRKIHAIKLKGFGALELKDGTLAGGLASWKEYILSRQPDLDYLVESGCINNDEMAEIARAIAEVSNIDLPQASFLHNDFHGAHIFSDGEHITGVIDLAGAAAGDPRLDIAITHFFLSPENKIHFDRGYGDLTLDPLISKYHLLVAAGKIEYRSRKGFQKRLPKAVEILKRSLSQGNSGND